MRLAARRYDAEISRTSGKELITRINDTPRQGRHVATRQICILWRPRGIVEPLIRVNIHLALIQINARVRAPARARDAAAIEKQLLSHSRDNGELYVRGAGRRGSASGK